MASTHAERQRRYIARLKAAAAPQMTINRIFAAAAATNFAVDAIEFQSNGSIIVRPKPSSVVPVQPDAD
jgi:hypothetical protein